MLNSNSGSNDNSNNSSSDSGSVEEVERDLSEEERRIFESISADLRLLSLEDSAEAQQEVMSRVSSKLSILAQSGRGQVLIDASSDGSSVVCPYCGQLIALKRFLFHKSYWCPASHNQSSDDNDVEM